MLAKITRAHMTLETKRWVTLHPNAPFDLAGVPMLQYRIGLHAPEASSVGLAADFNGWIPAPLDRAEDGTWWTRTPPLEPAEHHAVWVRYRFVVNGTEWIRDPDNPLEVAGDSVIELPATHPGPLSPAGRVEDQQVFSVSLGRSMRYLAWLPPGYDKGRQRYPVVYLLHGYRDGGAPDFLSKGQAGVISEQLLGQGQLTPMILICPEGEDSFYCDSSDGQQKYETYLTRELLEAVDTRYRTLAEASARGIGGLSMGGFGALKLALQYPGTFKSVWSFSGLFDVRDPSFRPELFGSGPESEAHRAWNSPVALLETSPERASGLKIAFSCGEQDHLYGSNLKLEATLKRLDIPHRFEHGAGYHTWDVVQRNMTEALQWHSAHLLRVRVEGSSSRIRELTSSRADD